MPTLDYHTTYLPMLFQLGILNFSLWNHYQTIVCWQVHAKDVLEDENLSHYTLSIKNHGGRKGCLARQRNETQYTCNGKRLYFWEKVMYFALVYCHVLNEPEVFDKRFRRRLRRFWMTSHHSEIWRWVLTAETRLCSVNGRY